MEVGTVALHTCPNLSLSHMRPICGILAVESIEVGTYHFTHVPNRKYDMDAYMATLLGGEAWDFVLSLEC